MDQTNEVAARAQHERISQAYEELTRILVGDFDLSEALDQVISRCISAGGASGAGIVIEDQQSLLRDVAYSDDRVRRLERLQIETGEGPCVQCVRVGHPIVETNLPTAKDRWPSFVTAAAESGYLAVRAIPLRFRARTLGALNLFDQDGGQCSPENLRAAQAFADLAVLAIVQHTHAYEDTTVPITRALAGRTLIEQAKGMLAEAGNLTMQDAQERLRAHATLTGLHTTRLAYALVHGDLAPHELLQER